MKGENTVIYKIGIAVFILALITLIVLGISDSNQLNAIHNFNLTKHRNHGILYTSNEGSKSQMTISEILNLLRANDPAETRENLITAIQLINEMLDELDDEADVDFCDEVDESFYDPYAGCDMYETEPFDMGW